MTCEYEGGYEINPKLVALSPDLSFARDHNDMNERDRDRDREMDLGNFRDTRGSLVDLPARTKSAREKRKHVTRPFHIPLTSDPT